MRFESTSNLFNSFRLISPCMCKGTHGFVHQQCLEYWLSRSGLSHCELCLFHFATANQLRWALKFAMVNINGREIPSINACSFWGYRKPDRKIPFWPQDIKLLPKLLSGITNKIKLSLNAQDKFLRFYFKSLQWRCVEFHLRLIPFDFYENNA